MKTLLFILALSLSVSAAEITITFTAPDAKLAAIIDDLAEARGYQPQVLKDKATSSETIPNPQSKIEFLKQSVGADLRKQLADLRANRATTAADAASKTATAEVVKSVQVK